MRRPTVDEADSEVLDRRRCGMILHEPCPLDVQLGLDGTVAIHAMSVEALGELSVLAERLPLALLDAVDKRQREFLCGRCCAARALAHAGHTGDGWVPRGDDRLPVWPDGWVGSISHSRFGAVAVAARSSPSCRALGVDMEPLVCATLAAEIEATVANPVELTLLAALPQDLRVTLLFSAKEALYKALYPMVRSFQDFGAAQVCGLDGNRLRLRLCRPWGPGLPEGFEVTVRHAFRNGHVYSLTCLP